MEQGGETYASPRRSARRVGIAGLARRLGSLGDTVLGLLVQFPSFLAGGLIEVDRLVLALLIEVLGGFPDLVLDRVGRLTHQDIFRRRVGQGGTQGRTQGESQ